MNSIDPISFPKNICSKKEFHSLNILSFPCADRKDYYNRFVFKPKYNNQMDSSSIESFFEDNTNEDYIDHEEE